MSSDPSSQVPVEKKKKHPGGRPSKFKKINRRQLKSLYIEGKTDKQVADFFEIDLSTLTRWKQKNSKFCISLKSWKEEADAKVEKSLYKRALGYKFDEVTYEKSKTGGLGAKISDGEIEEIKHVDTNKTKVVVKEVPPDVTAQIFWLKNRQPKQWRDKVDVEHSGDLILNYGHRKQRTS